MASLSDVVKAVAGDGSPPAFLPSRLEQMAGRIRAYVEGEESAPLRREMRDKLDAFSKAVMEVKEGVTDPAFETFIGHDWAGDASGSAFVLKVLSTLADRAHGLSNRFSGRAGAARAFPTDASESISSHQLCAWTAMEGMKHARSLPVVAADNVDAWHAANELYRFSGGMALGRRMPDGSYREPSGWRDHIIAVREIEKEDTPRGQELRHLTRMFAAISPAQIEATSRLASPS